MYRSGDLKTVTEQCEEYREQGCCDCLEKHVGYLTDARDDHKEANTGIAYLPHSCEEWVIGGEVGIKALINDLERLLKT